MSIVIVMAKNFLLRIQGPIFAIVVFVLAAVLQSCFLNTTHSFSGDKPCANSTDEGFCNMQLALRPHGCFAGSCHFSWGNFASPDDYVDAGLLVRGDPDSSSIYTQLSGAGAGGTMPLGSYADVSGERLDVIRDYIEGLE